jgi:methionyl-tRNA synthetase
MKPVTKKKFFITTPIYYVNDKPHIGHTCTTLAADILARYHKLLGDDVFFLTGTDEHGAKVAEEAKKANLTPQEFCDKVSKTFSSIWPKLNIKYDYFIRTTNPQHEKIVQDLIQKIYDNGDIYKAEYEGLYCVGCEKFITEDELVNGKCPLHPNQEIEKQKEENYFFKLSKYAPILVKAIEDENNKNHYQISPEAKKQEVLSKLKAGVPDLSISRANVAWGIPIPWDQDQTIYVWVDALINYYSALIINQKEDFWPADLHLIGKEILWFHAAIWEAMLISAGIPVPKEVFTHSFYMIDGQKMSKSLGNVISPQQLIEKFGVDGTRYLIASSFPRDNDSDISLQKFTDKYNANLANGLGNLVARIAKLCETNNFDNQTKEPQTYKRDLNLEQVKFNESLTDIWALIAKTDKYLDQKQPWTLKGKALNEILAKLVIDIKEIAVLIAPYLPDTSEKILKQFSSKTIKSNKPLFPRL